MSSSRAAVVIQNGDARTWLYGHFMGAAAISYAVEALRSPHLGDSAALVDLLFSAMEEERPQQYQQKVYANKPYIIIDGNDPAGHVWLEDNYSEEFITIPVTAKVFLNRWGDGRVGDEPLDHEQLIDRLPMLKDRERLDG